MAEYFEQMPKLHLRRFIEPDFWEYGSIVDSAIALVYSFGMPESGAIHEWTTNDIPADPSRNIFLSSFAS